MARRYKLQRIQVVTLGTLVAFGMGLTSEGAGARSLRSRQIPEAPQNTMSSAPIMAIVSIASQRVSLYDPNGGVLRARVSTGRTDYETPVGIYSVLNKEEEHYSNVYDDASMPFMQRITWSGLALHAGVLPGYPASHGCVRMPNNFAEQIFPLTKIGMRVIVAHDDVPPIEISHPFLSKVLSAPAQSGMALPMAYQAQDITRSRPFQPDLHNWPSREAQFEALKAIAAEKSAEADAATARADAFKRAAAANFSKRGKAAKALRVAAFAKRAAENKLAQAERGLESANSVSAIKNWEEARSKTSSVITDAEAKIVSLTIKLMIAHEEFERAREEAAPAEAAKAAAESVAKEAERKTLPLSIFISLKTQRLYVRQGYEPVFDAPIQISDPDRAIGTHLYTAVDFMNQGKDLRWTAVSLLHRTSDEINLVSSKKKRRMENHGDDLRLTDERLATSALNRITLPPDVVVRLSGQIWPRSSLIVSDEEMSKETGKATDFIVLISGEPQGGLKKRRRQAPSDFYPYDSDDYYGDYRYRPRRYRQINSFTWW